MALGVEAEIARVAEFPGEAAFVVLLKLEVPRAQLDDGPMLNVVVVDPEMQPTNVSFGIKIDAQPSVHLPDGWDARVVVPIGVRFPVGQPGVYGIEFRDGDTWMHTLHVLVQPAP